MFLQIEESIKTEVIQEHHLSSIPRWDPKPGSILIASHTNTEERERQFIQTIGSGNWLYLESNEFRFNKENLLLESIFVKPSEENIESDLVIEEWLDLKPVQGTLRLLSPQSFKCESDNLRWMSPDGKLLAAIFEADWVESDDKFRLRVAQDFDLLFAEQKWSGYMLSNPARYLAEPNSPADSDTELPLLAFEYVSLICEPNIDDLYDEEPEFLQKILKLRNKINLKDGAVEHRRVLYDCLNEIIEYFYGAAALNK